MRIVDIIDSPRLFKRYRVILDNGEHYDFGLDDGSTYIDHHNPLLRKNYWLRHLGNQKEKQLIYNLTPSSYNLTPSSALFSAYLLWGESKSLKENIKILNKLLEQKYNNNK